MSTLSDQQEKAISIVPIPVAVLSIFGSISIIQIACRNRKSKKWTPYTRLLIAISCCDIIYSITSRQPQASANIDSTAKKRWRGGTKDASLPPIVHRRIESNGDSDFYKDLEECDDDIITPRVGKRMIGLPPASSMTASPGDFDDHSTSENWKWQVAAISSDVPLPPISKRCGKESEGLIKSPPFARRAIGVPPASSMTASPGDFDEDGSTSENYKWRGAAIASKVPLPPISKRLPGPPASSMTASIGDFDDMPTSQNNKWKGESPDVAPQLLPFATRLPGPPESSATVDLSDDDSIPENNKWETPNNTSLNDRTHSPPMAKRINFLPDSSMTLSLGEFDNSEAELASQENHK